MVPLPKNAAQPWNRIRIDDVLDAINPHTCIRCLRRKDEPGANTNCATCQQYLDAPKNAAEHFLFFACLRIFDFWLWLRRKTLSDTFVLRNGEHGLAVEQYIGMPGGRQDLSLLNATKPARDDSVERLFIFWSPMERELLEQVMLTSRQCDRVLVLLADILKQELLQVPYRISNIDEILFNANHEYTSTHWCYRATLRDGRQFAIAFSDRQLGWLHIVRDWKEYVLDRFHGFDEAEALFYMDNPDAADPDEVSEDERAVKSWWKERGASARKLGGVQAAHVRQSYPQEHWLPAAVKVWADELPPYDMFTENIPEGWEPEDGLTDEQVERRQKRYGCHLVKDNGGVGTLWKMWEEQTKEIQETKRNCERKGESKLDGNGKSVADAKKGAEGKKRKLGG